ncbi:PrgI family protein [Gemella morbillorum]
MIDIRVPNEIRNYKEKIYAGLNLRQLICLIVAIVINVPIYWYGRKLLGDDLVGWIILINAIPIMAIGFVNYNGMNFEQLVLAVLKFEVISPQKRKYKSNNFYEIMDKEFEKMDSNNKRTKKRGIK